MSGEKFRAWDTEAKCYIKDPVLVDNFGNVYVVCEEPSNKKGTCLITGKPNVILERDTGLKDMNGEEICEGDIVHIKFVGVEPEIWVIGWDISLCRFGYFHSYKRILDGHWSDKDLKAIDYRRQPLEVIGNIHENPELLGD